MALAFVLSGPDNDSYMLDGVEVWRCGTCGLPMDREVANPTFVLRDRRWDLSYTYDGYCIVSERFHAALGDQDAIYRALPSEPDFFVLSSDRFVDFDAERRGTRFEDRCDECGRYRSVAGATPAFLTDPVPLASNLARTNVEFGTGDEQRPLLLVGTEAAARLRADGLAGLSLLIVEA